MSQTKKTDDAADPKAKAPDVPQGPGVATTADLRGPTGAPLGEAGSQEPAELTHPMTSGTPEAWAIPLTPGHKADRDHALKHAEKHAQRLAESGHLPPGLAEEPKASKGEKSRRERVADAKAKVQELNARHPVAQAATAAAELPELPPPPGARAVMQHSMSREEMQANGITDDLLANADGLGVDRIALCDDPKLRDAVQEYIDAVRDGA